MKDLESDDHVNTLSSLRSAKVNKKISNRAFSSIVYYTSLI